MTIRRGRLGFVSIDKATSPRDGMVLTDRWWIVHPDHGVAFYQPYGRGWSAQCNTDRRLPDSLVDSYPAHLGLTVRHLPAVFVGRWDDEYGYTPDITTTLSLSADAQIERELA